nr:alpha-E domain-containing protein [Nocardia sp. alder85J]
MTGTPIPLAITAPPPPDPGASAPTTASGPKGRPAADEPLLPATSDLELLPPQQQSRVSEQWRTAPVDRQPPGRAARRSPEITAAQRHSKPESEGSGEPEADPLTVEPVALTDRVTQADPTRVQAGQQGADGPPPAWMADEPDSATSPAGWDDSPQPSSAGAEGPVAAMPESGVAATEFAASEGVSGLSARTGAESAGDDVSPETAADPAGSPLPGNVVAPGFGTAAVTAGRPEDGPDAGRDAVRATPGDSEAAAADAAQPVSAIGPGVGSTGMDPTAGQEVPDWRPPVVGASAAGYDYLVRVTLDRELPGSLAYAIEHVGADARAVRDQLSGDTWMVLSAMDRALLRYRGDARDQESALAEVHAQVLAALLSLSGIDAESIMRDTGWYVADIGKRIERGLALTSLLSAAFTQTYPEAVQRTVTEAVLRATESMVSYRRRHRDSIRVSAVASLLLFDAANPRSLAHQLDRLEADLQALPGASGSSRPQRLLAEAQRMLSRLDPADLEATDANGRRPVFAELIEGVHLRLRTLSEAFETSRLAGPGDIQPLWGNTRVVE